MHPVPKKYIILALPKFLSINTLLSLLPAIRTQYPALIPLVGSSHQFPNPQTLTPDKYMSTVAVCLLAAILNNKLINE